jgi:hypothetical protein
MKRSLWVVLCCILGSAVAFGQTATTSLRGIVKDPSGALVPGASVTLLDPANGTTYHAVSDAGGFYVFPVVTPAHYVLTIDSMGFAKETQTVDLIVDQPVTINFQLSVQSASITVAVNAAEQLVNDTDATIGSSVTTATIEALPLDGRDPIALLTLQPGVLYIGQDANETTPDSRQGAVAGGRSDQGDITLDGLDDNDQVFGTAFTGILRSTLDSTQEFNVTTSNGTALAGRSSGAQVNLVTKSGTNQYHGALYEYYRPTNTVANDYFHKYDQLSGDSPNIPEKYVLNTFGGAIGAPIKKDKLFYFFNYEGQRTAVDQVVAATVPTPTFMQGELQFLDPSGTEHLLTSAQIAALDAPCASNTFNGAPVCPNGPGPNAAVLAYYKNVPTSTGTVGGDGGLNSADIFFASPAPATLNTSILRLDYNLSKSNRIFVRGNLQKDTTAYAENLPGQPPSKLTDDNTKGIAAGDSWTPNSHIVNDARYAYVRQGYQTSGIGKGDYVDIFGLTPPTAETRNTFLHVPVHNIADTLTWTKGAHTIALGGNWRMITSAHGTDSNSFDNAETNYQYADNTGPAGIPNPDNVLSGSFATSWELAWADLMGIVPEVTDAFNFAITNPTTATALPDGAFIDRSFRSNEFEYFLQDTWHARSNLNITLGLRHSILGTPYEIDGQQISPTIDTDAWYKERESAALRGQVYEPLISLAPSGKANGMPGYWPKQKDNIAPRLAVVFAPDPKTSIRASAGIYYDHYGETLSYYFDQEGSIGLAADISNNPDVLGYENAPRFTGPNSIPNIPIASYPSTLTYPSAPPAAGFGIDWGIDNHLKTPYAEAFDVSIQHEFPGGWVYEQDYIGRLGRHLLQQLDLAEPVDYVDPLGGGDYFSNARILSKEVDASPFGPSGVKVNNNVSPIPYFENVFPYMKGVDYPGESATQAIFNNAWAPQRYTNGETLALAIMDVFGIFPGSPNYSGYCQPTCSTFWTDQFSSLYAWDSIGTSSYNALQFKLRHPPVHGLTVDLGYTLAKSLDIGSETERANQLGNTDGAYTNFAIQNTWNPKLNKGPSDFDVRNMITGDWVYALPVGRGKAVLANSNRLVDAFLGGWQWAGLGRWTTGLPFTIQSAAWATNYNNPGFSIATSPIVLHRHITNGVPQVLDSSTVTAIGSGLFFGSPIRLPYAGEAGERNNYYGDGYFDIDSSLTKSWHFGDVGALKISAEAYNISNSARFDVSENSLVGNPLNPNLGQYSATDTTYRRMQFGLRYDF